MHETPVSSPQFSTVLTRTGDQVHGPGGSFGEVGAPLSPVGAVVPAAYLWVDPEHVRRGEELSLLWDAEDAAHEAVADLEHDIDELEGDVA